MKKKTTAVAQAFFRVPALVLGLAAVMMLATDAWAASYSVVKEAAYSGEYGLQLNFNSAIASYLEDDSPVSDTHYRARFYMNLSELALAEGDQFELFAGYRDKNSSGPDDTDWVEFKLVIQASGTEKQLVAKAYNGGSGEMAIAAIPVTDGWHSVEVEWKAWASNVNGHVNLWLDGEPLTGLTGLYYQDAVIDFVRWGVLQGNPIAVTGYMDLDDFASRRFDYIGINVRAAGCSGDEVTLDISKFPLPEDIPVLCQASRSLKTTDQQAIKIAQGMNLRIESPSTTLYRGFQVEVGGILGVGN